MKKEYLMPETIASLGIVLCLVFYAAYKFHKAESNDFAVFVKNTNQMRSELAELGRALHTTSVDVEGLKVDRFEATARFNLLEERLLKLETKKRVPKSKKIPEPPTDTFKKVKGQIKGLSK